VLDFDLGENACPVNELVKDTFIITNTTTNKYDGDSESPQQLV
jgi:hypothetical protein